MLALELRNLLGGRLGIDLHHLDVLPGLGQLRFELPDLVSVRPAIELEERLALLDRHVGFDQHRCNQRRFRKPWHELNGVLDHRGIGGIGCYEAQANEKN